jgi:hypothetical protein
MSSVGGEGSDIGPDGVPGDVSRNIEAPAGSARASASIELGRILDGLGDARREVIVRSERLLRATDPTVEMPTIPAPLSGTSVSDPAMTAAPSMAAAPAPATSRARARRLRATARSVATVVATVTVVLLAWLMVLEPLLGSTPVLIRDDGMSPSLRIGDVAFAEDPVSQLTSGAIVAVRVDGRVRVSRLIDREVPTDTPATGAREAVRLVLRDDAEELSERTVVDADALVGVIGAAVPRVGLPAVWLRAPLSAPLGAAVTLALLGVTVVGLRDAQQERRGVAGRPRSSSSSTR